MPEVNLKKARQAQQNKSCVLPAVNIQEKLLCFSYIWAYLYTGANCGVSVTVL